MAISTWHLAVSSLIGSVIPHQLFGLWVFPEHGAPVLLGPEALAEDHLAVPRPEPFLSQDELFELEEKLRQASYASAVALPIHGVERDVGLALVGTFDPGAYGPTQVRQLQQLAAQLHSTLDPLSRAIRGKAEPSAIVCRPSEEELPEALLRTVSEAPTGAELVRRLSGVLHAHLPHDRLELLAFQNGGSAAIPLSGTMARRRWGSPVPGWGELARALETSLGSEGTVSVGAPNGLESAPAWPTATAGAPKIHSLLAARLTLGEERLGLLVFGHAGDDVYRPVDEELAARVARLVSPRVAAIRLEAEVQTLRGQLEVLQSPSLPVIRAAEALAATAHLGEALHRFATELGEIVPHDRVRYRLRWSEGELVTLLPEAIRPLGELERAAVAEDPAREVLDGERDWLLYPSEGGATLAVALKVAERRVGLLLLEAASFPAARDLAAAVLPFAAVLAPHLELVRRSAVATVRSSASAPAPTRGE
ncbi:MAG: hypothetical protein R2909_22770 [Gemmatimonadales bacterium]